MPRLAMEILVPTVLLRWRVPVDWITCISIQAPKQPHPVVFFFKMSALKFLGKDREIPKERQPLGNTLNHSLFHLSEI